LAFDRGAYDDRVDALSGVYELCQGKRWKSPKFLHAAMTQAELS